MHATLGIPRRDGPELWPDLDDVARAALAQRHLVLRPIALVLVSARAAELDPELLDRSDVRARRRLEVDGGQRSPRRCRRRNSAAPTR